LKISTFTKTGKKEVDSSIIILISLLGCAFFSGIEIAFLTSNKLKIELDSKQGMLGAKMYSRFIKKPSIFITTTLLGNSVAIVVYGLYSEQVLEPFLEKITHITFIVILLKTTISTLFVLFIAEYMPKAVFSINPNRSLSLFAVPFAIIHYLLYPVIWLTMMISEGAIRLFSRGASNHDNHLKFGRIDLENYVSAFSEEAEENKNIDHEIQIFQNALDFSDTKIRECMIPRLEIIGIEVEESLEELTEKFISTGVSKIVVYRENIDNIIGFAHSYELFKKPQSIKAILLPMLYFPESMPAKEVMDNFLKERKSIGIVLDEFGGTAGLVTMEDVIEEIFGEINDEHDNDEFHEKKLNEEEFIFSGRLEIDYINEKYNLDLPVSDSYETIAGLILEKTQNIPRKSDVVVVRNKFEFTVLTVNQRRIELIKLKLLTV
jgi:putative hemolysin